MKNCEHGLTPAMCPKCGVASPPRETPTLSEARIEELIGCLTESADTLWNERRDEQFSEALREASAALRELLTLRSRNDFLEYAESDIGQQNAGAAGLAQQLLNDAGTGEMSPGPCADALALVRSLRQEVLTLRRTISVYEGELQTSVNRIADVERERDTLRREREEALELIIGEAFPCRRCGFGLGVKEGCDRCAPSRAFLAKGEGQ